MGKPSCGNQTQDLLVLKSYLTQKMSLGYKTMDIISNINAGKSPYHEIISYWNKKCQVYIFISLSEPEV
ncbi:hypothetical protein Hanom_Chr04g00349331 [Helianthus anomalus]